MARNWDIYGMPSQDLSGAPLAYIAGNYDNPHWAAYHNVVTTNEERTVGERKSKKRDGKSINI